MRRIQTVPFIVALAVLTPLTASAQTSVIDKGTVEINGVTGLTVNNQTISASDEDGDLDVKNASAALGLHFYLSKQLSIGVAGGFTRVSVGVDSSEISATTMLGGPQVRYRLGGDSTSLVLIGGAGVTRLKVTASGNDIEEVNAEDADTNGWFWEAGGDVSFRLRDNVRFNLGARYQATKSKDQAHLEFDTAGITVAAGFSFFFGKQ